jgi:hypothetical protein
MRFLFKILVRRDILALSRTDQYGGLSLYSPFIHKLENSLQSEKSYKDLK